GRKLLQLHFLPTQHTATHLEPRNTTQHTATRKLKQQHFTLSTPSPTQHSALYTQHLEKRCK
ncbi:MAG: hypothetical protein LRZ84_27360, partial [Desertifilum sp.]|nr:hypothetical protein [Desertifilum sp.]